MHQHSVGSQRTTRKSFVHSVFYSIRNSTMSHSVIDVPLIERIIREWKHNPSIRVIDICFKAIGAKGDNYTSEVNRILIKYRIKKDKNEVQEELSLFSKTMHESNTAGLEVMLHGAYYNEMEILAGPLKKMTEMLGMPRVAQLLYYHLEVPHFAIMEDLGSHGFLMSPRVTGLDLPHASLAIRNLAKFHASSVAVCEKMPEYKVRFRKHLFRNPNDCLSDFLITAISAVGIEISDWQELGPKYGEKLQNLAKVIFPRTQKAFAPIEDEFTVLTHGDCSQINMLFAYDEDKTPNDVALVDFQYACYSSPAVDLRYFLSCSVTQDVYQNHQESLIEEYHSVLSETMENLNCKTRIPSLEDLMKMYDDRIFVGVISTCLIEPILHADVSQVTPVEGMVDSDVQQARHRYQGASYRKIMAARLPEYDKLGLLDVSNEQLS